MNTSKPLWPRPPRAWRLPPSRPTILCEGQSSLPRGSADPCVATLTLAFAAHPNRSLLGRAPSASYARRIGCLAWRAVRGGRS